MSDQFVLGTCTVPDGKKGPWQIDTFVVTEDEIALHNLRCAINRERYARMESGTFRRLKRGSTIVMTNTPMEVRTNREAFRMATGRVLINGLGLGMLLEGVLSKKEVTHVRVVEISQDLIDLVGPHFASDPRVEIICADAAEYKAPKGERFNYVWHDIWDYICSDNLSEMTRLARRYARRSDYQGFWAKSQCLGARG
jgi:hypothetical protein